MTIHSFGLRLFWLERWIRHHTVLNAYEGATPEQLIDTIFNGAIE
jgi:hypothetical protein